MADNEFKTVPMADIERAISIALTKLAKRAWKAEIINASFDIKDGDSKRKTCVEFSIRVFGQDRIDNFTDKGSITTPPPDQK